MMPNPKPVITIDGATLSCEAVASLDTGIPTLSSQRPTLIGRMSIEWGREDQWTQPDPTVLTFTLWEPQPGGWLGRIVRRQSLRRGCLIRYFHGDGQPRTIFQGFTTNVDVKASRQLTERGVLDGWMVTIQCTDRSGFLGQIDWYAGQLPAETMQNRAVRVRNQGAGVGIRQVYFEDRFRTGQVAPTEVTDKTVLDTVNALYQSFADQWTYNPARNVIIRIPTGTRWFPFALRFGRSSVDRRVRVYPPKQVDTTGQEDPIDRAAYPGGSISGAAVSGDIVLSSNLIQDITTITAKFKDQARNYADNTYTTVVAQDLPATLLTFDSWYSDSGAIQQVVADVAAMCTGDGARPTHPQIRWDTARSGDIPDWDTFESLTLPSQTIRLVALTGSPFSAATGQMPVWHPCGGVVAYEGGRWDFSINLAPTSPELPADHVPVTSNTVDPSILLGDLDESISSFDLQFVTGGPAETH